MIHDIGVDLQAALRIKGCPIPVVDGSDDPRTSTYARERIVIDHDDRGDSFGPVLSQHRNPKHRFTRTVSAKITIYAQRSSAGALHFEHRDRAEHVLDLVLVCLDDVVRSRKNKLAIDGGKFVQPEMLDGSERPKGAVYELRFSVDRAVVVQTWAGDARPEATLSPGGIRSMTKVSLANGPDDTDDPLTVPASAETSCGA